jgi:hypothetical protein
VACDFFISVTAHFRIIYVLVNMEVGSRRLLYFNVTSHPTAAWTLQQSREAMDNDPGYRFLVHHRDSIYSQKPDLTVRALGVRILKTPFRSPQANSHCERLTGSLRRNCLDILIPMNPRHPKEVLKEYKTHNNQAELANITRTACQSFIAQHRLARG